MVRYRNLFLMSALVVGAGSICANYVELESQDQFASDVLEAGKPAVVKFAATWCGACKMMAEPFKEVAGDDEFDSVLFVNIDIDKFQDLMHEYNVAGVPTIVYLENKEVKNQTVGIKDPETIKESLRADIRQAFNLNASLQMAVDAQGAKVDEQKAEKESGSCGVCAAFGSLWAAIKGFFVAIYKWLASLFGK